MVKHPNCTRCDCGSSVDPDAGVKCIHCDGKGKLPAIYDGLGWSDESVCETCGGSGRIRTVEQYLKTLPADWHQDSSLETWFPLTAEEHDRYKRCLYRANGRLIQRGEEPEKLDYPERPELKAFVQLCAPHGKDWLTCPECAKAAVNGRAQLCREGFNAPDKFCNLPAGHAGAHCFTVGKGSAHE